jgi:uncharacterized protein YcbK (DUF882 family)
LQHAHFNTTLDVRYRTADGSYDPAALAQIRSFFRSRDDGRQGPISLRLVELLAYVQTRYHPRDMLLISGYRSPDFNAALRAAGGAQAQTSLHTQGLAADVALPGLDLKRTWLALRALQAGGVGYYRSGNFLHIDSGPPRFWEESTSRVKENLSADNARMFLRTDFDRYATLEGASLDLYSITTFPVLIAPEAELSGSTTARLSIEPVEGAAVDSRDGCFAITAPAEAYRFRVRAGNPSPPGRTTLHLHTCEPRVGKTPAELVSNPIEVRSGL